MTALHETPGRLAPLTGISGFAAWLGSVLPGYQQVSSTRVKLPKVRRFPKSLSSEATGPLRPYAGELSVDGGCQWIERSQVPSFNGFNSCRGFAGLSATPQGNSPPTERPTAFSAIPLYKGRGCAKNTAQNHPEKWQKTNVNTV